MNQGGVLACCAVCNQQTYRRCSRCLSIYYCNTEHQRQDWRRHKRNCGPKLPKQGSKNDKLVEPFANIEDLAKIEEQRELIASSVNRIIEQADVQKQESSAIETRRSKKAKRKNSKKERGGIVNDSKHNSQVPVENIGLSGNNLLNASEHNIPGPSLIRNSSVISSVVYTNKDLTKESAITYEGSSEQEILSESAQQLSTVEFVNSSNVLRAVNSTERMPMLPGYESDADPSLKRKVYPEASLRDSNAPFNNLLNSYYMDPTDPYYEVCHRLIRDMTQYGVCVLDNFLGRERGLQVLNEVLTMYRSGIFTAGRLVSNPGGTEARTVRSDRITWIDGKEPHCTAIRLLINQVDNIVLRANKVAENGKMGDYVINGRTKAMVACYPGSGSHYVKHVDNPNKDGRCITAIYYLNLDWDIKRCGGLLRVFPEGTNQVADIAPIFDRMLFFWSDRRNPHEVQPAYDTRYAITLWYFDAHEREEALLNFIAQQVTWDPPGVKRLCTRTNAWD